MMRLDKFLANEGVGTRKEVKKLIRQGVVEINGVVCLKDDWKIDENIDEVSVNGEIIEYQKYVYLMMNKPSGTICSNDEGRYPTVFEFASEYAHRDLFTVGRLDVDTVGLLLITDDGDFAHRIISPKSGMEKIYEVTLATQITPSMIEMLENGITFKDFVSMPARVEVIEPNLIHLGIMEGKFHQVKRMMIAVGNEVVYLKRIKIGDVCLDESLNEGDYRLLSEEELKLLNEK